MNPATGPKSVSFKFSVGGVIAGLGTLMDGLIKNPHALSNAQQAIASTRVWVGGIIMAVSIAAKLFHDHGFNKATIMAAGSEFSRELPQLRLDLSKTVGFVEQDFPQLQGTVADLYSKISVLESKVTSSTGLSATAIEDAVRNVFSSHAAAPAPTDAVWVPVPAPTATAPAEAAAPSASAAPTQTA